MAEYVCYIEGRGLLRGLVLEDAVVTGIAAISLTTPWCGPPTYSPTLMSGVSVARCRWSRNNHGESEDESLPSSYSERNCPRQSVLRPIPARCHFNLRQ